MVVEAAQRTTAMAQPTPVRSGKEAKVLVTTRERGPNLIGTKRTLSSPPDDLVCQYKYDSLQHMSSIKLTIGARFESDLSSLLFSFTLCSSLLLTSKTNCCVLKQSVWSTSCLVVWTLVEQFQTVLLALSSLFSFQTVHEKYHPKWKNDVLWMRGSICVCWYSGIFFLLKPYINWLIEIGFISPSICSLCCLGPCFKERKLASFSVFNSEPEASWWWTLVCYCLDWKWMD